MFKKKPQIKNLSPLRSSDRRKLADQIIADYHVPVPPQTEPIESAALEPGVAAQVPTLSSIRASLVPESCLSARFTTHAGANATLISGTVYVGSHPGQEERILWIQYGKEPKPFPTVYTLWQNPGLVPLLHTQDFVVEKLQSGADLMTPGLLGGPPWPEGAKQGSVVAVAGLGKETVPVVVGICKIDISSLGRVQGTKGPAVEGVTWYGDEIWNWSQNSSGGRQAPSRIEGWDAIVNGLAEDVEKLDVEEEDDDEEQQGDGGVALNASVGEVKNSAQEAGHSLGEEKPEDSEHEPTTAEIDQSFYEAFLYALYDHRKNGSPPNYGLDLPIPPSLLISNMVQPHLRHHSPHYTIKKTSWKNVKKFIKYLDKQLLVKSKDRQGGETVILDVDFDDHRITSFVPYKLPKPKATLNHANDASSLPASNTDSSLSQTLSLITLYRPSARIVPNLLPSKTAFYTSSQITDSLRAYISANAPLTEGVSSKRSIKLDPFIANNILSTSNALDKSALNSGEMARDVLNKRILEDANLCIPHYLLLRNDDIATFDSLEDTGPFLSTHKPKSYPPPRIQIILEKRTGSKTVTKISNLEAFFINPNILSPELQKKCAGSASVGQLMGGKPGMLEILVQGDQRDVLEKELGKRGVRKEWIEVTDKTKKSKK